MEFGKIASILHSITARVNNSFSPSHMSYTLRSAALRSVIDVKLEDAADYAACTATLFNKRNLELTAINFVTTSTTIEIPHTCSVKFVTRGKAHYVIIDSPRIKMKMPSVSIARRWAAELQGEEEDSDEQQQQQQQQQRETSSSACNSTTPTATPEMEVTRATDRRIFSFPLAEHYYKSTNAATSTDQGSIQGSTETHSSALEASSHTPHTSSTGKRVVE